MTCRQCGTEIADKALICYRCGTSTTEAKYHPYVKPRRNTPSVIVYAVVGVALLVLVAWFLLHSPGT
jgi:multisubunit Na+/H+ antiporter MnhB subunit